MERVEQKRAGANQAKSVRYVASAIAIAAVLAGCASSLDEIQESSTEDGASSIERGIDTGNSTAGPRSDECGDREALVQDNGLDSVNLEQVGENSAVSVSAAIYPLPQTEGNPWSQWGQGVVLPDGRFISAVGDHVGQDGTSWIYEYDPGSGSLARTTEVANALGHISGDWGYGKVHAPMVLSECGDVIGATYWGTRRDLVLGESYQGDHLFRYDTTTREIESLGVPVIGHGIPSLAISPDRQWIFGEAVDPTSDPDSGVFFVADAETGEVVHTYDNPDHVGFRSIMVSASGEGLYAVGGADVIAVDPTSGSQRNLEDGLPGDWLRASTAIGPDGSVYGTTREPDALFRLGPDDEFTDLGDLEDYVASLTLSPDGNTLYYVPGAHGSSWKYGTPVIAVDLASGDRTELVRLNELIEPALGVRAGGTYNIVADPSGERLFIGLNAGPIDDDESAFGDVVLAVVELK